MSLLLEYLLFLLVVGEPGIYPEYGSKVNAHYERIGPQNKSRKLHFWKVDLFGIHFDYAVCTVDRYDRIDLWKGVSHSVSRVDLFIMSIYFAHVFRVIDWSLGQNKITTNRVEHH